MTRCSISRWLGAFAALGLLCGEANAASPRLDAGVKLFQARDYQAAMGAFLDVLQAEPGNAEARAWQGAALRALLAEKAEAAQRESIEMMRASLGREEADLVALSLTREALPGLESGDILLSRVLLFKAADVRPDHPEVRRTVKRSQELVRSRLDLERTLAAGGASALVETLEGLVRLDAGDNATAIVFFVRAARLSEPGDAVDVRVAEFLRRARGEEKAKTVAAPVEIPEPVPAAAIEPETVTAPIKAGPPTLHVSPPQPAVPAVSSPKRGAGSFQASVDAYLNGVTDYMAGRVSDAKAAMLKALRLDPENVRARKMLHRIEREEKSGGQP